MRQSVGMLIVTALGMAPGLAGAQEQPRVHAAPTYRYVLDLEYRGAWVSRDQPRAYSNEFEGGGRGAILLEARTVLRRTIDLSFAARIHDGSGGTGVGADAIATWHFRRGTGVTFGLGGGHEYDSYTRATYLTLEPVVGSWLGSYEVLRWTLGVSHFLGDRVAIGLRYLGSGSWQPFEGPGGGTIQSIGTELRGDVSLRF